MVEYVSVRSNITGRVLQMCFCSVMSMNTLVEQVCF
jgi:hypothetical protein